MYCLKFWIKFNMYKKCSLASILFYIGRSRSTSALKVHSESKVNTYISQ